MTDPLPPLPPPEENPIKAWAKKFFKDNEWIINQLMRGIILLGIAWLGLKLAQIQNQNQSIEHKADTAAVAASAAQQDATKAATVGRENLKANTAALKVLANQTADPLAKEAANDAKDAVQATTQQSP